MSNYSPVFKANDKWSLDALYLDESKVRNKASYEIWASLSHQSIQSEYVELFVNNESQGIFRFSENYTETLLQMRDGSSLYVGNDNSEFTKFSALPNKKPKSAVWEDWEQEYPNPSEQIYWDDFYEFSQLITKSDSSIFVNEIENHIVLSNVIVYYLFISLLSSANVSLILPVGAGGSAGR